MKNIVNFLIKILYKSDEFCQIFNQIKYINFLQGKKEKIQSLKRFITIENKSINQQKQKNQNIMGIPLSTIFESWFSKKEMRILMVGLDAAGKTTILYKLKLGEVVSSVPTIGFNVEKVEYKNISFTVWDIGGQDKLRLLWRHYFTGSQGIIFVIDSSDKERINVAKEELGRLMSDDELRDASLLILANKFDISQVTVDELISKLELQSLRREWYVQTTCAITGDGLYQGLDWLSKQFKKRKN
ncbi:unnamed protein product [Paramecium sonneborni]|uniref:ADP-ribosylation factor n=1 Tax=Paramecium sonneborni TaxID=65129 RepID=A0A8S1NNC2_9CILI|nr:unnamed protein product [Paramecium sonneborni]